MHTYYMYINVLMVAKFLMYLRPIKKKKKKEDSL